MVQTIISDQYSKCNNLFMVENGIPIKFYIFNHCGGHFDSHFGFLFI